jgi:molybdopterin-guanine dinucleotide biosynthesis protein A
MGGDKAWLKLGGRSIIEIIAGVLGPLFGRLRVIANESKRFESLAIPVQPDLRPGQGPLGGIHAALSTARSEAVFIIACDFPFLNAGFIKGLVRRFEGYDAVVPRSGGRPFPVCAVYSVRCLPVIDRRIDRCLLKTDGILNEINTRWVTGDELEHLDPEGVALTNLNTPEDYEKAKALVEVRPSILPL